MEEKRDIEQLLKEGKTVQFHPMGTSMFPLFVSPADYAVVAPIGEKIKKLDVLVYRRPEGPLVIHRVKKTGPEGLYMVGDRQVEVEGPLQKECALGVMTGFVRKGHSYSVKYFPYRVYSALWMLLRPVRLVLFKIGHYCKVFIGLFLKKNKS